MFEKFDFTATSKKQRLIKATLIGLLAAIVLGVLYSVLTYYLNLRFEFSIFYALLGLAIGTIVQKIGRGVTKEFAILAAVLTITCLIVADLTAVLLPFGLKSFSLSMISYVVRFQYIESLIGLFSGVNIYSNGMFLLFRIVAVVMAVNNARPSINR